MNPSRKIAAALDENTRAYVLPCSVTVEDAPNRFTLNLTALDSVGVAFDNLDFVTTDRQDWSSAALNAWGERLAARVTYLLEPLKVLEIDAGGGEVQIRSKAPSVRADQRDALHVTDDGVVFDPACHISSRVGVPCRYRTRRPMPVGWHRAGTTPCSRH